MSTDSKGGLTFDAIWRTLTKFRELDPVMEYRFGAMASGGPGKGLRARLRERGLQDWRFDRAWPDLKIAVEIDGGNWMGGRHTRGAGFEGDLRKINCAQDMGWLVYRYTISMLERDSVGCIRQVENAVYSRLGK